MTRALTSAALLLAQWWTWLYTAGLPRQTSRARRAELRADLWEFKRDLGRGDHGAAAAWARLLLGVPDDLSWRLEHRPTPSAWWAAPVLAGVLMSFFWFASSGRDLGLPERPPAPAPAKWLPDIWPPPPPPPPPSTATDARAHES